VGQEWGKNAIKEKGVLDKIHKPLILLVRPARLERAAFGFVVNPIFYNNQKNINKNGFL